MGVNGLCQGGLCVWTHRSQSAVSGDGTLRRCAAACAPMRPHRRTWRTWSACLSRWKWCRAGPEPDSGCWLSETLNPPPDRQMQMKNMNQENTTQICWNHIIAMATGQTNSASCVRGCNQDSFAGRRGDQWMLVEAKWEQGFLSTNIFINAA